MSNPERQKFECHNFLDVEFFNAINEAQHWDNILEKSYEILSSLDQVQLDDKDKRYICTQQINLIMPG